MAKKLYTKQEIIKALDMCLNSDLECKTCPLLEEHYCVDILYKKACDYIDRKACYTLSKENLISFNDEQLEEILAFQEQEGFNTVQEAIMAAVLSCLRKDA